MAGTVTGAALGGENVDIITNAQVASEVGKNAVENNYLYRQEAKEFDRLTQALSECKAKGDDCSAIEQERNALSKLDEERNHKLNQACLNIESEACLDEMVKLADARASYRGVKKGRNTGPTEYNEETEANELYVDKMFRHYQTASNKALLAMVKENFEGPGIIADIIYKAIEGDEDAQAQLVQIGKEIVEFAQSPIATMSANIRAQLAEADRLEAEGKQMEADVLRAKLYLSAELTAIDGARAVLRTPLANAGRRVANVDGNKLDNTTPDETTLDDTDVDTNQEQHTVCASGDHCFAAGTLVETARGLIPIEQLGFGDLIWSREEFGNSYAYKPVIATKATENQQLVEVVVENKQGQQERYLTTTEHPFYVENIGWLKATLLASEMKLLDRNGIASLSVISQNVLARYATVYNIMVDEHHTYHVGEFGVWVHNAKCCDLTQQEAVQETKRGVISRTKLENGAIELDTTEKTSQQVQDIAQYGDPTGMKTEALFNDVVAEHGGTVLTGGKYGGNKGYDHVVVFKDAEGNTYLTMVVDSKQLNSKGVVLNHNAAGGTMQMSDKWEDVVLDKLDENSEAYKAIQAAKENGTLVKGAAYVDKTASKLNLVRIAPITR